MVIHSTRVSRTMPTLLTRDEIVIELGMLMHDDGVMGDGEASNHVIDHPSDGSSTNVVSSSSKHHAGRGVLAVIGPTTMTMMSITLLVHDGEDHRVEYVDAE